ncbi:hypothetical protein C815_00895 [Firmicutes bacterium M10-2]|nr:hypothetical protein C815_00895 [Firmicutes bacterium M10-2]
MNIPYNKQNLVKIALNAKVDHPRVSGFYVGYDGKGRMPIGTGGIVYSHEIGDSCMNIAGDHIEPGVSMANSQTKENHALETFSCIGNEVKILSGSQKGAKGIVTGTHGGVDHTMAYFPKEVIEEMDGTEIFLIKAYGQGMKLDRFPNIHMMNIDPELFDIMPIDAKDNTLSWPVVTCIPAHLMGSGLGSQTMMEGDYDIMTQDEEANEKYGINNLRFGDFVAILDHDCTYGPHYKEGAVSIGVVVHSDSFTSGHGPGVTVVATTSEKGMIEPRIERDANLKTYIRAISR